MSVSQAPKFKAVLLDININDVRQIVGIALQRYSVIGHF